MSESYTIDPSTPGIINRLKCPLQRRFLENYQKSGEMMDSLKIANMSYELHCDRLSSDQEYMEAFNLVQSIIPQLVEDQIIQMAIKGVRKPIVHEGKITGYYREKDFRAAKYAIENIRRDIDRKSPGVLSNNKDDDENETKVITHQQLTDFITSAIESEKKERAKASALPAPSETLSATFRVNKEVGHVEQEADKSTPEGDNGSDQCNA
ncbi:MAG TPA: hypothetical protein VMV42_01290 [archaeon]|nr:hypothetical protein [archaeon]